MTDHNEHQNDASMVQLNRKFQLIQLIRIHRQFNRKRTNLVKIKRKSFRNKIQHLPIRMNRQVYPRQIHRLKQIMANLIEHLYKQQSLRLLILNRKKKNQQPSKNKTIKFPSFECRFFFSVKPLLQSTSIDNLSSTNSIANGINISDSLTTTNARLSLPSTKMNYAKLK